MMASRSNMGITNPIKELVSKNRNRYRQDGFNLDLTYITSKIIAMGFPASKIEGCYRNHIDDVVRMLDMKHKDHYKIYNLCSERSYDPTKFHNRVEIYPFDDHNPPRLELIQPFCVDVHAWLQQNDKNIAVVHCKAGKGRTGTMICCYLLHSRTYSLADEALSFYGHTRTQDQKGVTIPSQVRYVRYYGRIVQEGLSYKPVGLYLTEIKLEPPPMFGSKVVDLYFSVYANRDHNDAGPMKLYKSTGDEMHKSERAYNVKFKLNVPLLGDTKIELHSKSKISKKAKLFQFWFNTFFVTEAANALQASTPGVGCSGASSSAGSSGSCAGAGAGAGAGDRDRTHNIPFETDANGFLNNSAGQSNQLPNNRLMLCLRKSELDIVNKKDKQNKTFSADFKITLYFLKQSPNVLNEWHNVPHPTQQERSSGSSEASDTDSSEWDSGESTVL